MNIKDLTTHLKQNPWKKEYTTKEIPQHLFDDAYEQLGGLFGYSNIINNNYQTITVMNPWWTYCGQDLTL